MKKKVVFIGNSIVAGYPWSKGKSFVSILRKTLKGDPAAGLPQPGFAKSIGFDIINKGVNGDTTAGLMNRFREDVLDGQPDHVYFFTGTNDFIYREATPDEAFKHLEAMSDEAESRGILPVYLTPIHVDAEKAESMWMSGFGVSYAAVNRDIDTLSALIRQSGRLHVDLNQLFDTFAKGFDDVDLVYLDGVHPMPEGHAFIAGEIIRFMGEHQSELGM